MKPRPGTATISMIRWISCSSTAPSCETANTTMKWQDCICASSSRPAFLGELWIWENTRGLFTTHRIPERRGCTEKCLLLPRKPSQNRRVLQYLDDFEDFYPDQPERCQYLRDTVVPQSRSGEPLNLAWVYYTTAESAAKESR